MKKILIFVLAISLSSCNIDDNSSKTPNPIKITSDTIITLQPGMKLIHIEQVTIADYNRCTYVLIRKARHDEYPEEYKYISLSKAFKSYTIREQ